MVPYGCRRPRGAPGANAAEPQERQTRLLIAEAKKDTGPAVA